MHKQLNNYVIIHDHILQRKEDVTAQASYIVVDDAKDANETTESIHHDEMPTDVHVVMAKELLELIEPENYDLMDQTIERTSSSSYGRI